MENTVDRLTKVLIAQHLARNNYKDTLHNFLKETSLPRSVIEDDDVYEPLEKIVAERIEFNEHMITAKLETLTINNKLPAVDRKFHIPSWDSTREFKQMRQIEQPSTLVIETAFNTNGSLLVATAGKTLSLYDSQLKLIKQVTTGSGIVKKCGSLPSGNGTTYYYACQVDGTLTIYNSQLESIIQHKIHRRIVTEIAFFVQSEMKLQCFSSGLDNYVKLHTLDLEARKIEFCDEVKLISALTSFQLAQTGGGKPVLFLTRLDFTQVLIFTVCESRIIEQSRIALNNAQFSTHTFNVWSMILLDFKPVTPNGSNSHLLTIQQGTMLAVATSHTPYMRLILVEVPPIDLFEADGDKGEPPSTLNVTEKACGALTNPGAKTYFDKILRNIATTIQQDSFSHPILKAFPLARGLVVGGDNGVYAVDISNGDTWQLLPVKERTKAMDVLGSRIVVSFASSELAVWECI